MIRIVHFDDDQDDAARAAEHEQMKRRLAYQVRLDAHPHPSDPDHPGPFAEENES